MQTWTLCVPEPASSLTVCRHRSGPAVAPGLPACPGMLDSGFPDDLYIKEVDLLIPSRSDIVL